MSSLLQKNRSSYRPEIDGLRALAVIAVIINHFNKNLLPGGYLGVDIFFVISGFVITSSLENRPSKSFGDFLTGFYTRRIKRLVPVLVVFVLITSVLICLFNPEPEDSIATGVTSLFGLSNLYLFIDSTDYFANSTELNVFTHTWSLGVEEQFYFLFPFLVWFTGFSRLATKGARNLFLLTTGLSIASLLIFIYLYQTNQSAAYFLMPARLWELSAGCIGFLGIKHSKRFATFLKGIPPLLVIGATIAVLFTPLDFAVQATIAVVALTVLLIGCLRPDTAAYNLLAHPQVVYIGLISYSLYLWHWAVLSLSRWTIGIHWWSAPFQIALMLLLAITSYRLIETPLRHSEWSNLRWKSIFYGVATSAASVILVLGFYIYLSDSLYLATSTYPYTQLITRSRNEAPDKSVYSGDQCHLEKGRVFTPQLLDYCRIEASDNKPMFYFLGNSHTDHFRTTHFLLASKDHVGIDGVTTSSCRFPYTTSQRRCDGFQAQQEKRVLQDIRPGDVAVISNRYVTYLNKRGRISNKSWVVENTSIDALLAFNQEVKKKGGTVVLFAPIPEFPVTSVYQCISNWYRPEFIIPNDCNQPQAQLNRLRASTYEALTRLSSDILIYDPSNVLCKDGECRMIDAEGKPLYVDNHHLNDYANSEYIYRDFAAFLVQHNLLNKTERT